MKRLSFTAALVAALFISIAFGTSRVEAFGYTCEDLLFPGDAYDASYSCDLTFEGGNIVNDVCVDFSMGVTADFTLFSPNFPKATEGLKADCSCEAVRWWDNILFDRSKHHFLCASNSPNVALSFDIWWTGGPITGQAFAAGPGEIIYSKCHPVPKCEKKEE